MKRLALALLAIAALVHTPASAQLTPPPATQYSIAIPGTVATASVLIAGVPGQSIYVVAVDLVPVPTSVVTFTAGGGSACGTNTVSVTGVLTFSAGQTYSKGNGAGALWVIGPGLNLCLTVATAASPGSISYSIY